MQAESKIQSVGQRASELRRCGKYGTARHTTPDQRRIHNFVDLSTAGYGATLQIANRWVVQYKFYSLHGILAGKVKLGAVELVSSRKSAPSCQLVGVAPA
jgi:hypothetical protein